MATIKIPEVMVEFPGLARAENGELLPVKISIRMQNGKIRPALLESAAEKDLYYPVDTMAPATKVEYDRLMKELNEIAAVLNSQ